MVSGSQDFTVKVWDLPADLTAAGADLHQLTPRTTEKAHDKVHAHAKHSQTRKERKKCLRAKASIPVLSVRYTTSDHSTSNAHFNGPSCAVCGVEVCRVKNLQFSSPASLEQFHKSY